MDYLNFTTKEETEINCIIAYLRFLGDSATAQNGRMNIKIDDFGFIMEDLSCRLEKIIYNK